jgi:hypothetical protein
MKRKTFQEIKKIKELKGREEKKRNPWRKKKQKLNKKGLKETFSARNIGYNHKVWKNMNNIKMTF